MTLAIHRVGGVILLVLVVSNELVVAICISIVFGLPEMIATRYAAVSEVLHIWEGVGK